jgi:hypothetical protein
VVRKLTEEFFTFNPESREQAPWNGIVIKRRKSVIRFFLVEVRKCDLIIILK